MDLSRQELPSEEPEKLGAAIRSRIEEAPEGSVVLVLANPLDYKVAFLETMRMLLARSTRGIVVTLDRSSDHLVKAVEEAGLEVEGLFS